MRLLGLGLAVAALGISSPANAAATCSAAAAMRTDLRWRNTGCHECMVNRVYLGPGTRLHWNGASVGLPTVRRFLTITRTLNPEPYTEVVIRPGADCGLIAAVRETIQRTLSCGRYGCPYALVPDRPRPRRTMPNPG